MPLLLCPACKRSLSVPDHMAGTMVRCPSCQSVFTGPAAVPVATPIPRPAPVAPTAPIAPPVQAQGEFDFGGSASSSVPSPGQAFGFEESRNEGFGRIRIMARTGAAASWLTTGAFLYLLDAIGVLIVFLSTMGSSGPRVHSDDIAAITAAILILLGLAGLFVFGPMVLIILGARNLRSQKSYGMAMTGAVVAIIVSVPALLGGLLWSAIATLIASTALSRSSPMAILSLLPLAVAIVLLATGGCCLMGAIQAFRALGHPEVAEAFRARREGR